MIRLPDFDGGRSRGGAGVILFALVITAAWTVPTLAASWVESSYQATIATHFNASGQAQSGSVTLVLNHTEAEGVSLNASAGSPGSEVLKHNTSNDTLATQYKLTGTALDDGADNDWVSASDFIDPARSYPVSGVGPSEITLHVRGVSSSGRASDAGTYSASLVLTASW